MWKFESPIGTLCISQNESGRYSIVYGNKSIGFWHSPKAVADDVYTQHTGLHEWDDLDLSEYVIPTDISEWEQC